MSKNLLHATTKYMLADQIKVFATPEAYNLIEGDARGVEFFQPVREAIKLALDQRDRCGGYSSAASPLGFWARWNYLTDGTSVIMICKTDYLPLIPFYNDFDEILEAAVPIWIV